MKNVSILKILRIILVISFVFQAVDFFTEKNGNNMYQIISACMLFGALIFAFAFGNKLEQEKIDIEKNKKLKV